MWENGGMWEDELGLNRKELLGDGYDWNVDGLEKLRTVLGGVLCWWIGSGMGTMVDRSKRVGCLDVFIELPRFGSQPPSHFSSIHSLTFHLCPDNASRPRLHRSP
jgi:hypothetical protein